MTKQLVYEKRYIMGVLTSTICILFIVHSLALWRWHIVQQADAHLTAKENTTRTLKQATSHSLSTLQAIADALQSHPDLQAAMLAEDRDVLYRDAADTFQALRQEPGLGQLQLYFHLPDQRNLLRMHQPQWYGDLMDRPIMRRAVASGQTTHGMEIGRLNTLAFRIVRPWRIDQQLIGYIEIGVELDQVLQQAAQQSLSRSHLLIDKRWLTRERWEESMRQRHYPGQWDTLSHYVEANPEPNSALNASALETLLRDEATYQAGQPFAFDGQVYMACYEPIVNSAGEPVAKLLTLHDVTRLHDNVHLILATFLLLGGALSAGALGFAYLRLNRIERRFHHTLNERDQFHERAEHDGLTKLYNHATFYQHLDALCTQAERATEPLALVMLDIDWFKRVNDTHGHPAGDKVLEVLASRLQHHIRPLDEAARYGGEEFAVILRHYPDSAPIDFAVTAERLRQAVCEDPVPLDNGQLLTITVSAGLAECADATLAARELVTHADAALYRAKQNGRDRLETWPLAYSDCA